MKTIALILALATACVAGRAIAQTEPAVDGLSIGIEAQGSLPMGDFSDASNYGVGGTVYIAGGVAPQFSLTGRTGYLYFGGKETDYSTLLASGTTTINLTMVPFLAGMKYFFSPGDMRVYGAVEGGIVIVSGSGEYTPIGGVTSDTDIDSETDVALAPSLGIQFKGGENLRVDARASFTNVFTEGSSTNWLTFGIGFEWGLN